MSFFFLEVYSDNLRVATYEENLPFVVDEPITADLSASIYSDLSDGSRESTPVPLAVLPSILRLPMQMPKDPLYGFVFGSDHRICDVIIDVGTAETNGTQFAIKPAKDPGVYVVKNLGAHGTLMRHESPMYFRVKKQRAFGRATGDRMDIRHGGYTFELHCPDHTAHFADFGAQWSSFYNKFTSEVTPERALYGLALSAGPSSTHASVEYYHDGDIGRGIGTVVHRVINRRTGLVYALKSCKSLEYCRKEAAVLSRIKHVSDLTPWGTKTLICDFREMLSLAMASMRAPRN